MRVSDSVRKNVVFIGVRNHIKQAIDFGGTGFLVRVPGELQQGRGFVYLVTAKHVTEKIKDMIGDATFVVRANTTGGSSVEFEARFDHWSYHPDDSVDVAVSIFAPPPEIALDTMSVPISSFLTDEDIRDHSIGAGDEVFMTGLFTVAPGTARNMPLVRMGNVALMPEEKIRHGGMLIDAYLVEGRSIGALSGSPAFVSATVMMPYRSSVGSSEEQVWLSGQSFFMGLVRGHWDDPPSPAFPAASEKVNMGISIVVPAKRIKDIINSIEQKELRRAIERSTYPVP